MANLIPIKDDPNFSIELDINSKIYNLHFLYNEYANFWNFSIIDYNQNNILSGVKIIPNFPLIYYYKNSELPIGDFYCKIVDKNSVIDRNSFKNSKAKFFHISNDELAML